MPQQAEAFCCASLEFGPQNPRKSRRDPTPRTIFCLHTCNMVQDSPR